MEKKSREICKIKKIPIFLVEYHFVRLRTNVGHLLSRMAGLAKLAPYCLSLMVKASIVNSSLAPTSLLRDAYYVLRST